MAREESSGGSCGVASGAGRGRLYAARKSVRDSVASLRDNVVKNWVGPVQADIEAMKKTAAEFETAAPEDRQTQIRGDGDHHPRRRAQHRRPLERTRRLDGDRDARARAVAWRSSRTSRASPASTRPWRSASDRPPIRPRSRRRSSCAMSSSAKARPASPMRSRTSGRTSAATRPALVHYVFTGGASGFTTGGEPITGRDMIALLATIGIDLGLFVLALLDRPGPPPPQRRRLGRERRRACTPCRPMCGANWRPRSARPSHAPRTSTWSGCGDTSCITTAPRTSSFPISTASRRARTTRRRRYRRRRSCGRWRSISSPA